MTRTTCDICGKLIIDSREKWLVSIQSTVGIKALKCGQENYDLTVCDVCQDCTGSIYHYIQALKKSLDKSAES